jgi:protein-tyrosine phosphatase
MGNICRSPMAEAVFRDLVVKAGLSSRFEIDSAGTINSHAGEPAHPGTRQILARHHIHYEGRARRITSADLTHFDYLIMMDDENLADVRYFDRTQVSTAKMQRLLDFATATSIRNVPDPYYSGHFDQVYQLVLDGCRGLLAHLRQEYNF